MIHFLTGVHPEEVKGNSRKREIVYARHLAIYTFREILGRSLKATAEAVGRWDHSTTSHAVSKLRDLLSIGDTQVVHHVELLTAAFQTDPQIRGPLAALTEEVADRLGAEVRNALGEVSKGRKALDAVERMLADHQAKTGRARDPHYIAALQDVKCALEAELS